MGALSNGGKRRKGGNLSALRSDHDDGVRSDRRGGVPITSVAIRAVRKRLAPRARLSIVARAQSGPQMGRRYDCSRPPSSWIPCAFQGRSPDKPVRMIPQDAGAQGTTDQRVGEPGGGSLANPNDEVRAKILRYFYDRNAVATSKFGKKGSAAKIS